MGSRRRRRRTRTKRRTREKNKREEGDKNEKGTAEHIRCLRHQNLKIMNALETHGLKRL